VVGVLIFVVLTNLHIGSAKRAILGFVNYGTYGLTNLALVKEWPCIVTVLDISNTLCRENAVYKSL
jgi:uncharacterized membrane protein